MNWAFIEVPLVVRLFPLIVVASLTAACAAARAQDEGRDQLLHYSLQVEVDEEARIQLTASQTELARGDVLTAVSRWRAMLDRSGPGRLVPFRGAYVSAPRAISALVRSLPAEVRVEYLRLTEPQADRALADAIATDDFSGLWGVVERFPGTTAARMACVQLAERCFDAGRFIDCRLAVDQWFDEVSDARAAVTAHPQMAVWRRLSLLALNDVEAADRRWAEYVGDIPPALKQIAATGMTRWAPLGPSETTSAPRVTNLLEALPSDEVVWSVPLTVGGEAEWGPVLSDFEQLAHPMLMVGRPQVTPAGLLVGGSGQRLIETNTGAVRWAQGVLPAPPAGSRLSAVDAFRDALGESITGRVVRADDRVLTVRPLQDGRPRTSYVDEIDVRLLRDGGRVTLMQAFPVPSGQEPQRGTVLGPPGAGHGRLYALLETDQQLSLTAFDARSLETRWKSRLGDGGLSLLVDHRRRWMPAVFDTAGESVLCATGNGAVASVDPGTGRLQWIHRSEREDWRNAGPPPMSGVNGFPRFRMWTGWREPVLKRLGDVVVWAGPEANAILGLDCRAGAVLWSLPRGDGLAVAATESAVIVLSSENIRRLNPVDGTTMWSTPIAAPAGTGFAAGEWYVVPLRTGGCAAIRLDDGSLTRSVAWGTEVLKAPRPSVDALRSLTWTPQGIVVQTPDSVALHRTVADVQNADPARSTTAPWLAAAGRIGEAERIVAESAAGGGLPKSRLQLIARETSDDQFHITARPFERLPEVAIGRDSESRVAAFLLDRRPETAIELLATVAVSDLSSIWVESGRGPRLRLRADVLAAGTILGRPAGPGGSGAVSISPAQRSRLDAMLKRIADARPDDLPSVLNLLSRSDWGASQIVDRWQSTTRGPGDTRELARRRLTLLGLEGIGGDVGARAAQLGAALAPTMKPLTDWPEGEIKVSSRAWPSVIGQWPVPFTPLIGSELQGLSIDLLLTGCSRRDQGNGIHFAGCGEDRPWEIDLARSDRSLGQSADYRKGLGIGPLVVMQSATGLHGLLPFDASGERGASRLWDVSWIDMWGSVATHSVHYLPRLSDVAPGRHPLDVDDFGRPLTQVGPVEASFFCYREFGRLVCCDTTTGRRRWDRRSFEPEDIVAGDATTVVLVSPSESEVEILDPLDGRLLAAYPMTFSAKDWRSAFGTTASLRRGAREAKVIPDTEAPEPSALFAVDLKTGQQLWTHDIDPAAVEFRLGRRLVGAVDSVGIRFFDPQKGTETKRVPIDGPGEIVDVHAVDDPFAVMICVFGPPSVEQLRPPLQLVGSRRKPLANGTVYGLDPKSLELKWSLPLARTVFPLDQPRDVPLLVIADAVIGRGQGDQEVRVDRIRCFDKRTGLQVGEELRGPLVGATGIVIERSQDAGWVEVRTARGIFRFDLSGR